MEIGKLFVSIGVDLKGFKAGFGEANKDLSGFSGAIQKHSKTFKLAGVAMVGAAAGAGIAGLKMAGDFDTAMREVNTMMGLGEDEFKGLSDQVLETSKDIGKAPAEMAQALYQVISAGIPAGEAMEFLGTSAKAAIGGVTDTETAVDGLTTVINAFGMDASKAQDVADIMFTTVKGGKTTFEELSAALFNVAPIAAASNIQFKEVAAALATMTKQGVPTKIATTQLRQAMVSLNKPSDEMKMVIEELGYASGETMLSELGLGEALNILAESAGGSNEKLMTMFGSVEAGQAVLSLTGANAETFRDDLDAMSTASDGAGASTEAFNEMNKGAGRQFEKLMVQIKGVTIELGRALMPAILAIVRAITPLITKIADWITKNPKLTAILVVMTGVVGVLLLVLGFLPAIMGGITAAAGIMGAVMTFALGPIGLIIIAIAAVIAIGLLLWKNWDKIANFFKDAWERIKTFVVEGAKKVWDFLKKWGLLIIGIIFPVAGVVMAIIKFKDKIVSGLKTVWDAIVRIAKAPLNAIIGLFNKLTGFFSGKVLFEFKLPSWIPGIGGKGFTLKLPTIPKIPNLQYGGVVPGPRGAPIPIIAHGGEEFMGVGGGAVGGVGDVHIHTLAFVGDRTGAKKLWDLIREEARRDQRTMLGGAEW